MCNTQYGMLQFFVAFLKNNNEIFSFMILMIKGKGEEEEEEESKRAISRHQIF